jgi:predicted dinucleotide-binding enzyme
MEAGHGAKAATLADLVADCEIVLLTLPFHDGPPVLEGVRDKLDGKIVIDVTTRSRPTGRRSKSATRCRPTKKSRGNSLLPGS